MAYVSGAREGVLHAVNLGLALAAVWLLLSGIFTPFLLVLGAFSCVLVVLIAVRMDVVDRETVPIHLGGRIMLYWIWLIWQIVLANIDVAKRVLSPSLPISPRLIKVSAMQEGPIGQVIFANSITLTPGTVSVDVDKGEITVHALTEQSARDILEGPMNRKTALLRSDP